MGEYRAHPRAADDAPLQIEVVNGEIVFMGPRAIAFAMTEDAARKTRDA